MLLNQGRAGVVKLISVGLTQIVYLRSIFVLFCAKISKHTGHIYGFGQPYISAGKPSQFVVPIFVYVHVLVVLL